MGLIRTLLLVILIFRITDLAGQVPVHEEPFHRPVFQNKEIRILNVVIPPGDTSLYHIHNTPSVFVFLTSSAAGTQLQGKGPVSHQFTAGRILFEDLAAPNTRIHRAWNADKEDFHVMDVELLLKDTGFKAPPLPKYKLEVDTPWVRVYKVKLVKEEKFDFYSKANTLILISLDGAEVEVKKSGRFQPQVLKKGSYFNVQKRQTFTLKNTSVSTLELVMLELPGQ